MASSALKALTRVPVLACLELLLDQRLQVRVVHRAAALQRSRGC